MNFEKVFLNKYGYYELKNKPVYEERKNEFENDYFQNSMSSYEQQYDSDEITYFQNKLQQKKWIIEKNLFKSGCKSLIDVGCGEGFALDYFEKSGYNVTGLDFSQYGIQKHNPHMKPKVIFGDCYESIQELSNQNRKFDIINIDSVLDMVLDPELLIELCKSILHDEGIMVIKVANNYSDLQLHLISEGKLEKDYWLDESGHPSYFNKEGLINLFKEHKCECIDFYGESFIDLNLLNENTNYYANRTVGKSCYKAKVELENLLHEKSIEKTMNVYKLLGEMGFGREIIGVFKKGDQ